MESPYGRYERSTAPRCLTPTGNRARLPCQIIQDHLIYVHPPLRDTPPPASAVSTFGQALAGLQVLVDRRPWFEIFRVPTARGIQDGQPWNPRDAGCDSIHQSEVAHDPRGTAGPRDGRCLSNKTVSRTSPGRLRFLRLYADAEPFTTTTRRIPSRIW